MRKTSGGNTEAKIRQLRYLQCEQAGHESEPLSRVCIGKECPNKTLVCSLCEEEHHCGHQTLPLKQFLSRFYGGVSSKQENNEPANYVYYAKSIELIRESYFNSIGNFRSQINDMLVDLQAQSKIFFNDLEQKLLLLMQFENPIEVLHRQNISQAKIKKYFEQIIEQVKEKPKFSLFQKLSTMLLQVGEKQKKLNSTLSKIRADTSSQFDKIRKSMNLKEFSLQKANFSWSEQLKGAKIKITGNNAQQTGMESSGQRFIMMEPCLNQMYANKISWGVKVIKLVGWVGVGISLRNAIQKANFFFNYSNVGHGSYMISNNGYSWSHSASQFNSAQKAFSFVTGDTVFVEYDKSAKKLRFQKNQGPEKFQLDIADPPAGDGYSPCANICSTGDEVELVSVAGNLN